MSTSGDNDENLLALTNILRVRAIGEANAISGRELAELLHIEYDGPRQVRAIASRAPECGFLICSGQNGYYWPETPEEVDHAIANLRSRAADMLGRAAEMERLKSTAFSRDVQYRLL